MTKVKKEEALPVEMTVDMLIPPVIAAALVKVQKGLKPLQKTSTNEEYGSKYTPLEEVMTFALELLNKEKIAVTQPPTTGENGEAALMTILIHESGAMYKTQTKIAVSKVDPQSHASAITYMRRKAIESILGITSEGEDDDGNAAAGKFAKPTDDQIAQIKSLCQAMKYPRKAVAAELWKVKTRDHAALTIRNLNEMVSQKERDNEARDRAEREEFGIPVDDTEGSEDTQELKVATNPLNELEQRMLAVGLTTGAQRNKFVNVMTQKPFLSKCNDDEVSFISAALKRIESGEKKLPDSLRRSAVEAEESDKPNDAAQPQES